jgi:hypothetical protein
MRLLILVAVLAGLVSELRPRGVDRCAAGTEVCDAAHRQAGQKATQEPCDDEELIGRIMGHRPASGARHPSSTRDSVNWDLTPRPHRLWVVGEARGPPTRTSRQRTIRLRPAGEVPPIGNLWSSL